MSATLATEDVLIIETPERVPLHFALASIGNRFLACAIDHGLQLLTIAIVGIAFIIVASYSSLEGWLAGAPKWVYAVMIVLLFLIFSGYFAFFEWIWSGQTPGKRWLKLRVIREDGEPFVSDLRAAEIDDAQFPQISELLHRGIRNIRPIEPQLLQMLEPVQVSQVAVGGFGNLGFGTFGLAGI